MKARRLFTPLAIGLGMALALLAVLSPSSTTLAQTGSGVIRVAISGSDGPGCGSATTPCRTLQYAIDQAQTGEEIRTSGVSRHQLVSTERDPSTCWREGIYAKP